MRSLIPVMLAAVAMSAAPAWAQPLSRQESGQVRTAPAEPVKVASFAAFDRDCRQHGLPALSVTRPPAHGTLSAVPARVRVRRVYDPGQAAQCRARRVNGIAVIYTPRPGFRGTDAFSYDVQLYGGGAHRTVTVAVE
jgi:hypothetical protein